MVKAKHISRKQARRLALSHSGLHTNAPFGRGRKGVVKAIQKIGYVQVDTISVVNRAHHHVLWSRVPGYQPTLLNDVQINDRQIFEFWSHAAAYLPTEDFRFTLPMVQSFQEHRDPWPKSEQKVKDKVLDRIRAEGPLMARDFQMEGQKKGDGWWDWKPSKVALQRLFLEGELLIRNRIGFQKVFDLTERIIPNAFDQAVPSKEEYARYLIERTINSHGLAATIEMAYLRKGGMHAVVKSEVQKMTEAGELQPLKIKGIEETYYTFTDNLENAPSRISRKIRILNPFDNTVIQRNRLSSLFDFDYQIECYVPAPKRIHGYYVLPILYGDDFIGRMDAKADRKKRVFYVQKLSLETSTKINDVLLSELASALVDFMRFNNCDEIVFREVFPNSLLDPLISLTKN